MYVGHVCEPWKNGWTDQDAIWWADLGGPNELCSRWGRHTPRKGQFLGVGKHWDSAVVYTAKGIIQYLLTACSKRHHSVNNGTACSVAFVKILLALVFLCWSLDYLTFIYNEWGSVFTILLLTTIMWFQFSPNSVAKAVVVWHRSPALPPSCFHGACYLEKLDVLRENGRRTVGLRFHIFYEGSSLFL